MADAVASPELAVKEKGLQIETWGDRVTWRIGNQEIHIHPAQFFRPDKHGVNYKSEVLQEAIRQTEILGKPESGYLLALGKEWDPAEESAPDPADYNLDTQVTMAIAYSLEQLPGTQSVRLGKDHTLAITPIHEPDKTLTVRREISSRPERKPTITIPEKKVSRNIKRQAIRVEWMPTEEVQKLKPKGRQ
jgi:hypothetical protein